MMTEHAPPIALRIGLAAGAAAIAATLFDSSELVWTDVVLATVLGVIFWAFTYIFVYVAEQYLYETGRLTMHPVDEMKETFQGMDTTVTTGYIDADTSQPVRPEAGDAYVHLGVDATGKDLKLVPLLQAINEGMDTVSKRQLESYGVISDRTSKEGDEIIDYLVQRSLIRDIGNSQYAVTPQLISFLTRVTGEQYVKRIRAN